MHGPTYKRMDGEIDRYRLMDRKTNRPTDRQIDGYSRHRASMPQGGHVSKTFFGKSNFGNNCVFFLFLLLQLVAPVLRRVHPPISMRTPGQSLVSGQIITGTVVMDQNTFANEH